MKKNKKSNKKNNYIKASDSKKKRALEFFDRSMLFLLIVMLASLAVCFNRPYELSKESFYGPALWFLHLAAWPLLFLPGVVNNFAWAHNTAVMRYMTDSNPALLLALLGCLLLGVIYLVLRRYGLSWFGQGGMRTAAHFILIFAFWGVFQLAISAIIVLKDTNTLTPFNPTKKVVQQDQNTPK